jgi:MFS family permease
MIVMEPMRLPSRIEPHHEMTDADRNWRRFVLFRVLFNSRFYYPVLAVLFLDLGVSATEYTLLNFAWALAIVFSDLPAGALADRIAQGTTLRFPIYLNLITALLTLSVVLRLREPKAPTHMSRLRPRARPGRKPRLATLSPMLEIGYGRVLGSDHDQIARPAQ